MKTIFLGDLHMGVRNDSTDFLEYQMKFFEQVMFPYCEKHGIKCIMQVGDSFDKRKQTNTATLYQFRTRIIERAKELGITLVFIIGNHDIYYRDSLEISTPYEFFGLRYDHVHVITEPSSTYLGKVKVDLIPWICKENSDTVLQHIAASDADIALGHFELNGFTFAKGGQVCEGAMSPKVLRKYNAVYSGHFHGASENGNIKYIGTPYQLTWSDYDDPKGFLVFDDETSSVEFVKNPFELYHVVEYNDEVNTYAKLNINDFHCYKDAIVKLVVKKKKSKAKFGKFRDMFYQVGVLDLNIVDQEELSYDGNQLLTIAEAEDTSKLIEDSVDNVQAPDIDTGKLKTMMTGIHDRAVERRSTF